MHEIRFGQSRVLVSYGSINSTLIMNFQNILQSPPTK